MVLLTIGVLIVLSAYIYLQTTKPVYSGSTTLKGLKEEVEVLYDAYGVPHIYAKDAEDAYSALGYVHAQDRLFQMEMLRRAAGGRLSEIFGKDLIPTDKLFRTLGLNQFAEAGTRDYLSADTADFQRAALAYQRGVNEYVRTGKTPIEFSIIGIPKTEFTPKDIYLVLGFIAVGFAEGMQVDPVLEKIRTEFGEAYLKDLAVHSSASAEKIKNYNGPPKKLTADPLIAAVAEGLRKLPVPLWSGSNGMVIAGNRTASGFPILENDTHMQFMQPAVWYEAHIEYPGFRFYGHHLAGMPFGLLGNNQFCGWGFTMFENDDVDFFREELNPENANQVRFGLRWEELVSREEVIQVKDAEDVVFEVKSSRHGPIINGIMEQTMSSENPVSLWWSVHHQENYSLQAFHMLNHATQFEHAQKAASLFTSSGLNLMYGDTDGNIAWWAVAKLPIRPAHVNSKLFLDGASGKDEYLGYYDFSKNPHAVNPPWGFVYSANNQPDSVDGVLYPGYYYPRSRAGRIARLLSEDKVWTINEVKKIALDVESEMHPAIGWKMADVLASTGNPRYKDIIQVLKNWHGEQTVMDIGPSVYFNMLSQTMSLAMIDELGWDAYNTLMVTAVPRSSFDILIANESSPWWDDITTTATKETRTDIISHAADKALTLLAAVADEDSKDWQWGKFHSLTHAHALSVVKPLDKLFSVGPFPQPGGGEVINDLDIKMDTTGYFPVFDGPALRKITDFGDLENGETISPTGQSGNVMSPHYADQAKMFATGQFRKMLMNRPAIERQSQKLVLKPAAQ